MKRANLVASPRQIGNSPVAKGSRVPVWPARSAWYSHLTRPSALVEDRPSGLSRRKTPVSGRRAIAEALFGRMIGVVSHSLVDQAGKTHATLDGGIDFKMQSGYGADRQHVGDLRAQETGGALQAVAAGFDLRFGA